MQNFIDNIMELDYQYNFFVRLFNMNNQYDKQTILLEADSKKFNRQTYDYLKEAYLHESKLDFLGKKLSMSPLYTQSSGFDLLGYDYNNNKYVNNNVRNSNNQSGFSTKITLGLDENKMKSLDSTSKGFDLPRMSLQSINSEKESAGFNTLSLEENAKPVFSVKLTKKDNKEADNKSINSAVSNKNLRADSIRKRAKTIFNNYIVDVMNNMLKDMTGSVFMFKLPKNYSTNLNKKFNKELLSKTVYEVFSANPINDVDLKRIEHNREIMSRKDVPESFKAFLTKTFKELFAEFLNSSYLKEKISYFEKHNGKAYAQRFEAVVSKFVEHFEQLD